jgi:formylglycine-generating enzyme required for sulfatase activity
MRLILIYIVLSVSNLSLLSQIHVEIAMPCDTCSIDKPPVHADIEVNQKASKIKPSVKVPPAPIVYKGTFVSDIEGYVFVDTSKINIKPNVPLELSVLDNSEIKFLSHDSIYTNSYRINLNEYEKTHGFSLKQNALVEYTTIVNTSEKLAYFESVLLAVDRSFLSIPKDIIRYNGRELEMPSFEISRFEVTKEQFRLFANSVDNDSQNPVSYVLNTVSKTTPRVSKDNNIDWSFDQEGLMSNEKIELEHPVAFVSWDEAKAYCAWLSQQDSEYDYRLPFSYEWDYVASNAMRNKYPWDNEILGQEIAEHANLADISRDAKFEAKIKGDQLKAELWNDDTPFLSKVGSFEPNSMGMYDMAGNVAEWLENAARNKKNNKLIRGGSYFTNTKSARIYSSDEKYSDYPSNRRHHAIGFRLVRVPK